MSIINYILDTLRIINNLESSKKSTELDKLKTTNDSQFIKLIRFPKRESNSEVKKNHDKFKKFNNIEDLNEWNEKSKTWDLDTKMNYNTDNYKLYNLNDPYNDVYKNFSIFFKVVENMYIEEYSDLNLWFDDNKPTIKSDDPSTDPVFIQKVTINNPNAKIAILGDFHSSLHSLIDILINLKERDYFKNSDKMVLKKDKYIFFLGDLVDRGAYSLELLCLAFILKKNNKNNVFIINGNHEDYELYSSFSFSGATGTGEEIKNQFTGIDKNKNYLSILFYLPSAIYLKFNGSTYHLSHGAFDLEFSGYIFKEGTDQWGFPSRIPEYKEKENKLLRFLNSNRTFALIKNYDYINQYKWGDFHQNLKDNYSDGYHSGRDNFSKDIVNEYCTKNKIKALITGHQDLIDFGFILENKLNDSNNSNNYTIGYDYNTKKYIIYKFCDSHKYREKLYEIRPKDNCLQSEPINGNVILKPGRDFIASVVSSATVSKKIPQNTYLELDNNIKFKEARNTRRGSLEHVNNLLKNIY